jgi:phytoene synthase
MVIPDHLTEAYRECRRINRRAGSTFYWAAQLLPRPKRPHVHALYAFARRADDIVDEQPTDRRADELGGYATRFFDALERGRSDDPVIAAVVHTAVAYGIEPDVFRRFLQSMEMDLTIATYETWGDLLGYMDGSAAVIGEMMLPILGPDDLAAATPPARDLGLAFQLTNFLRDIDEDLDRGRQYLPQEDLRRFGVDLSDRRATTDFVRLMRFEVARCRDLYAAAEPGFAMLPGRSERCIRAAHALYSRLLDRIEECGYDVFAERVSFGTPQKLTIVGRELIG